MQIIKVLPSDSRVSGGRTADDGTAVYFTVGLDRHKNPIEVGNPVEDGLLVFLPDRAATHVHAMDVLGIPYGRMADVDASNAAEDAVQVQAEAQQAQAVSVDLGVLATPTPLTASPNTAAPA